MGDPRALMDRLTAAQNAHDLEAMLGCFHDDYRSEQPLFPARTFQGIDQVRANWSALLEAIADFRAETLRSAVDGDTVFAEIHWTGTKADGTAFDERGVLVMGIRDDRLAWGVSTPTKSNTRATTSTPSSAIWRALTTVSARGGAEGNRHAHRCGD